MSKTRVIFRVIPGTEEVNGTIHTVRAKKVLQGKKWWMLKWHDCYTRQYPPDEDEFYPIATDKLADDENWKKLLNDDKYVWIFFQCFPIKL